MNKIASGIALGVALLAFGCGSTTRQTQTTEQRTGDTATNDRAMVRFVNADPNRRAVDLWFGDTKAFSNIAYETVTPYTELPTERRTFRLRGAGDAADLATNNEGLWDGRHYTIVAVQKEDGSTALTAVSDDLKAPEPGKAKVRVINAAPKSGDIDLLPAGHKDAVVDGVDFNSASSYKDVEPMPGAYEIRREDSKGPAAARVSNLNMAPGKLYTIIVTGKSNALNTIRIEDQVMGPATAQR